MEIIPAIDLIEGKCVRLSQGDYNQKKIYNEDPVSVAVAMERAGIKRLHLVDLEGARSGEIRNLGVLSDISDNTQLAIDFSGGIKTEADIQDIVNAGATYAGIGSMAVTEPEKFRKLILEFGADRFLLGADVKNERIAIHGWQGTSERSLWHFLEEYIELGLTRIFCTDISKDGMLQGPSLALYEKIVRQFPSISLIASGGVSSVDDLHALEHAGCYGAIVGKAIYEGKIKLEELAPFLK